MSVGVEVEADFFEVFSEGRSNLIFHGVEGDVFVVSAFDGFVGGGEDGFWEFVGELKVGGEWDAADGACGSIVFPAGADEVSTDHTFYFDEFCFSDEHGASF